MNNNTDLHDLGVAQLAAALRAKQVSAVEAAQHFLARAKAHQGLAAYLAIDEDVTLAQARAQDAALATGQAAPLAGLPIAHKGRVRHARLPPPPPARCWPATARRLMPRWSRVWLQAGCVTLGKLSCDEFAMGASNEKAAIAPVGWTRPSPRITLEPAACARRSSGGSAVAVAARLAPAATGTDTGGSSASRPALRRHRHQAHLRPRQPLRHDRLCLQPGSGGHGTQRRGLRPAAGQICGPDPERDATSLDHPAEDFTRGLRGASIAGLHRRAGRIFQRWPAGRRAHRSRGGPEGVRKLGHPAGAHQPAAHRAVGAGVLHPGPGRGQLQPVAL